MKVKSIVGWGFSSEAAMRREFAKRLDLLERGWIMTDRGKPVEHDFLGIRFFTCTTTLELHLA